MEHPIATITCHTKLDEQFKLPIPFLAYLLPIYWDDTPGIKQINHPGKSDKILFLRHNGQIRGNYAHMRKPIAFRNSMSLDVAIHEKIVNLKVSASTVHMCGIKQLSQIDEVMLVLCRHYMRIYKFWEFVRRKPRLSMIYLIRFLANAIGPTYTYTVSVSGQYDIAVDREKLFRSEKQFEVIAHRTQIPPMNDDYPIELYDYWSWAAEEWYFHPELSTNLIEKTKYVAEYENLHATTCIDYTTVISMMNFSYGLGFKVNLLKLRDYINNVVCDSRIRAIYDSNLEFKLAKIVVDIGDNRHNFMIYAGGNVTQSGQDRSPEIAFNILIPMLKRSRKHFQRQTPSFQIDTEDFLQVHQKLIWSRSTRTDDKETTSVIYNKKIIKGKIVW